MYRSPQGTPMSETTPQVTFDTAFAQGSVVIRWGGAFIFEVPGNLPDKARSELQAAFDMIWNDGRRAGKREVREALEL